MESIDSSNNEQEENMESADSSKNEKGENCNLARQIDELQEAMVLKETTVENLRKAASNHAIEKDALINQIEKLKQITANMYRELQERKPLSK